MRGLRRRPDCAGLSVSDGSPPTMLQRGRIPYLRYYNLKRPHAGCAALTPMKKLERPA